MQPQEEKKYHEPNRVRTRTTEHVRFVLIIDETTRSVKREKQSDYVFVKKTGRGQSCERPYCERPDRAVQRRLLTAGTWGRGDEPLCSSAKGGYL